MSAWKVKKGNMSIQDMLVKDRDGNAVTNLASASTIKFQVKESKTATVKKIEKTKGAGITVDTPSEGYLRITLTPTDTALDVQRYVMALEIDWGSSQVYEVRIFIDNHETDEFIVEQDAVIN